MGLDSIEILVEVEKAFEIKIPDQEAEKIITVGNFHDVVWLHVNHRQSNKCKSQGLFYKLRQSLVEVFHIPKESLKPDTSLNDIFPQEDRRKYWRKLSLANGLDFPNLVLPPHYSTFLSSIGLITIGGGLAISLILMLFFDFTKWTLLIPLAGISITYFISKLLNSRRTEFTQENISDLTNKILVLNYNTLNRGGEVNRKEVELIVSNIIADNSGLELDEVTPDKKICDDLGIN